MIYFLAALPQEEYDLVLNIFELFEACDLKDQKISKNQRGSMAISKLDCKGVNFKPLRNIDEKTRKNLLSRVCDRNLCFAELGAQCKYVKQLTEIRKKFVQYVGVSSWEAAKETYPDFTRTEKLEAFKDMSFKGKTMPPPFVAYCKQAKQSILQGPPQDSSGDCTTLSVGAQTAVLQRRDVLEMTDRDLLLHSGLDLTILDPPKVTYTKVQS